MVRSLLRPYENRAWAQSNWLLVRFWQGRGFAFREARAPEGFLAPVPRPNPTMSDTGLLHRYCGKKGDNSSHNYYQIIINCCQIVL